MKRFCVAINQEEHFNIFLSNCQKYDIHINNNQNYDVDVENLVSIVKLNSKPNCWIISCAVEDSLFDVLINVFADEHISMNACVLSAVNINEARSSSIDLLLDIKADVLVSTKLTTSEDKMLFNQDVARLTREIIYFVGDWTESTMMDLSEMTIYEMSYGELE